MGRGKRGREEGIGERQKRGKRGNGVGGGGEEGS